MYFKMVQFSGYQFLKMYFIFVYVSVQQVIGQRYSKEVIGQDEDVC